MTDQESTEIDGKSKNQSIEDLKSYKVKKAKEMRFNMALDEKIIKMDELQEKQINKIQEMQTTGDKVIKESIIQQTLDLKEKIDKRRNSRVNNRFLSQL